MDTSQSDKRRKRYRPTKTRIEQVKRKLFVDDINYSNNNFEVTGPDYKQQVEIENLWEEYLSSETIHMIFSKQPHVGCIWKVTGNTIRCDMMDPITKLKRNGEPLDPVPNSRWATNVVCGEGANKRMAQITGPLKNYIFALPPSTSSENDNEFTTCFDDTIPNLPSTSSSDTSPETSSGISPEVAELQTTDDDSENSPPDKSSLENEDVSKPDEKLNTTHVGEQTPHTSGKEDRKMKRRPEIPDVIEKEVIARVECDGTPQPIQLRGIPMPEISWTDNVDLSLRLVYKEEIGLTERNPNVFRRNPNLNTRMRAILFDWLMEVCDVYKLRRVTYYLTIDYIDRYLSRVEVVPKNHLQLLGITCLFIASKFEEIYPPKVTELAYVTDGACTDSDMLSKELEVLTLLRWDVCSATSSSWLAFFFQLATTKGKALRDLVYKMERNDDIIYPQYSPHLFMTGSMILDLCSLDDGMLQFKYSQIAAAVVYFTLNRETALLVSGYTWQNIKLCVEWMEPFALVVFKTLSTKPIVAPREYVRSGSALRCVNPNIVLEEGHCIQNHVVDLAMLEEVYNEVKIMRENFKLEKIIGATGWTASEEGFDPVAVETLSGRRKSRHISSYNPSSSDALDSSSESESEQRQATLNVENSPSVLESTTFTNRETTSSKSEGSENSAEHNSAPILRVHFIEEQNKNVTPNEEKKAVASDSEPYDKDGDKADKNKKSKNEKSNSDNSELSSLQRNVNTNDNSSVNNQRGIKRYRDEDDEDDEDSDDEGDGDGDGDGNGNADADDDKSSNAANTDMQPCKKSYCDAGPFCNQTLLSPACSRLYMKEGECTSFSLKPNYPTPSIVAPKPSPPPLPTEDQYEAS